MLCLKTREMMQDSNHDISSQMTIDQRSEFERKLVERDETTHSLAHASSTIAVKPQLIDRFLCRFDKTTASVFYLIPQKVLLRRENRETERYTRDRMCLKFMEETVPFNSISTFEFEMNND